MHEWTDIGQTQPPQTRLKEVNLPMERRDQEHSRPTDLRRSGKTSLNHCKMALVPWLCDRSSSSIVSAMPGLARRPLASAEKPLAVMPQLRSERTGKACGKSRKPRAKEKTALETAATKQRWSMMTREILKRRNRRNRGIER